MNRVSGTWHGSVYALLAALVNYLLRSHRSIKNKPDLQLHRKQLTHFYASFSNKQTAALVGSNPLVFTS